MHTQKSAQRTANKEHPDTPGVWKEGKKLSLAQISRLDTPRLKLAELRRDRCVALYFICNLLCGRISWPALSRRVILWRGADGALAAPLGSPGLGRQDQHVWFVDSTGTHKPFTFFFFFPIPGNMSTSVTFSTFWLTLDAVRIGPETCGGTDPSRCARLGFDATQTEEPRLSH